MPIAEPKRTIRLNRAIARHSIARQVAGCIDYIARIAVEIVAFLFVLCSFGMALRDDRGVGVFAALELLGQKGQKSEET